MDATLRQPASFRFKSDLLETLKARAKASNRSLNNFVESILLAAMEEDEQLSHAELLSIQRGVEDIKNGRTYRMQENESLTDFLNRTIECTK